MKKRIYFFKRIQLILLVLFFSLSALAQSDKAKKFENFLDTMRLKHNYAFNGIMYVSEKGSVVFNKAMGYANFDKKEMLNEHHVFDLASESKEFVCMGAMILKERGKLAYDDDLQKFFPDFPVKGITVRHLMTHTSGLHEYLNKIEIKGMFGRSKMLTNESFLEIVKENLKKGGEKALDFPTGSDWMYCNTGFALLVSVMEKASGEKFEKFMRENIFTPLGMNETYFLTEVNDIKNLAYGHKYKSPASHKLTKEHDWNRIMGPGGIFTTLGDMLKWDAALYTDKLVSNATLQEAFSPVVLTNGKTVAQWFPERMAQAKSQKEKMKLGIKSTDYGFGWFLSKNPKGEQTVWHTGNWNNYHNLFVRNTDRQSVLVIFMNSTNPKYTRMIFSEVRKIFNE